ncbi:MAG: hypothetical protein QOK30_3378, partial [Nocardioidaceae bacterium]|nr:hypothetical protein [Nocardioidaceae bacterium]
PHQFGGFTVKHLEIMHVSASSTLGIARRLRGKRH